jgi:hypothetical protein
MSPDRSERTFGLRRLHLHTARRRVAARLPPRLARAAPLVLVAVAAACGEPLPDPLPRIVSAAPSGIVPAEGVRAEFTASHPLSPEGIVDGRRVAICRADDLAAVKKLAGQAGGLGPGAPVLAARSELEDGDRRIVVVPAAPLVPGARYAALLAPGVRASDGRPVLDPEGRQRPVVVEFEVAPAAPGAPPPVHAAIVEVLSDAATPEAGGEYVEVLNLGDQPLDLAGFRLAKAGASGGTFTRCAIAPRLGGPVPPGGVAFVAGGAYDGRYALAAGTVVYGCGTSSLAGGLANDRPPALQLEDPAGGVVSSIGIAEPAPRCAGEAVARLDPAGPDEAANFGCVPPSPGT